jgi:hypothetical protein
MSSYQSKISRTANAPLTPPDETEQTVAQAILDLENNVPELKSELRVLQISAAREVDVKGGKKAIIIFVPVPQLKAFHKIQQRFVLAGTSGRASTPGGALGRRGLQEERGRGARKDGSRQSLRRNARHDGCHRALAWAGGWPSGLARPDQAPRAEPSSDAAALPSPGLSMVGRLVPPLPRQRGSSCRPLVLAGCSYPAPIEPDGCGRTPVGDELSRG